MIRLLLPPLLVLTAFPAQAADRTYSIGSFDRIRIEGPYEVKLTTGKAPGGRASGDDHALDALVITVEGQTMIVRARVLAVGESPAPPKIPLVITLTTPDLRAANVNGGGRLVIAPMVNQRIDLSVNGAGGLSVQGIDADQLNVTVIGAGTMTLAGRVGRARYQLSGPGTIEATALIAKDLIGRSEGNGEVHVAARYTADVSSTGLGAITVAGKPACRVQSSGGGPILCQSK
ncbi:head GIN domain-containing protein [Sphingomonas sp. 28-63-12]|uniref:head GIN domain-containing protein n=1 Tax=Sphingomonas sp. 28-63-12 TaxID=1970434 RepID=UPI000BC7D460|nr:MAG: hypothetical protein B7Y47_00695 [Sphingomonas sp. 28-63-12]